MALGADGKLPAIGTTDTDDPTSATVTRKVRGARQVVVDLGGLAGASYPAAFQLSRK